MPGFRAILRSCCPHWRLSAVLFLSLLSMALFFCADRNNPFADVSNARVHIVDPPFGTAAQGDSLRIFTTYSFNVVIALCEEVDSFCVIIPSNRLGDTLVYRNGDPKAFGAELYPVSFSLCDTGLIPITQPPGKETFAFFNLPKSGYYFNNTKGAQNCHRRL